MNPHKKKFTEHLGVGHLRIFLSQVESLSRFRDPGCTGDLTDGTGDVQKIAAPLDHG